jgi:hypothetical protein
VFFAVSLLRLSDLCIGFLKCKRSADVKWHDVRTARKKKTRKSCCTLCNWRERESDLCNMGRTPTHGGAAWRKIFVDFPSRSLAFRVFLGPNFVRESDKVLFLGESHFAMHIFLLARLRIAGTKKLVCRMSSD